MRVDGVFWRWRVIAASELPDRPAGEGAQR